MPWGKLNGKDAPDAMKDPEKYYSEMKTVLLQFKPDTTANETISLLLNDIVELLRMWYKVFQVMRGKERPDEVYVKLALAIDAATRKHRSLY